MTCAAAVLITLHGNQSSDPALDAEIRTAIIGVPIAVGLYVWNREPWERFGKLLVAAGFAWSLTTLAQSSNDLVYSAGRAFAWLVEPFLIYLMLAFPSGHLQSRAARALIAASVALVAVLYLPTMLLTDSYPSPSPWSSCNSDCPSNAFQVVGSEPGFVPALVALRELVTVMLFAGVVAVLLGRIRAGSRLMRTTLVPVLAAAVVHAAAFIAGLTARRVDPDSTATDLLLWVIALSVPAVAVGFLIGLWRWRVYEHRSLRQLAAAGAAHPGGLRLRETADLLNQALDPSLELFYRSTDPPSGWLDVDGNPATMALGNDRRCVTEVVTGDGRVVALVHDAALGTDPTFLDAARSAVLPALETERLATELTQSLKELSESRARIIIGADRERRRIERNLHDGAQQSLVALRIRLELAGELVKANPGSVEQLLRELREELDEALEEVRALARGVYPSLLVDRGLKEALGAAALRSPIRTTVDTDGIGRYAPEIEAAVYFCCLEAMQNAMKHAEGVSTIAVTMGTTNGDLRFDIQDDGIGYFDDAPVAGGGLTSMRDRLAAVGGVVTIRAERGSGTNVSGSVPV
jgi:signal transduction histidine kinase